MKYITGEDVFRGDVVEFVKVCCMCGNEIGEKDTISFIGERLLSTKKHDVGHSIEYFKFITRGEPIKYKGLTNTEDKI